MNKADGFLANSLDEIIARSVLRLEQERIHVGELQEGSVQYASARARFKHGAAALKRLRQFREKLDGRV